MKRSFAASALLCILLAGVPASAALRPISSSQPTVVSEVKGSTHYAAKSEPIRFLPTNTQYNVGQKELVFSLTNTTTVPITITGEGTLETELEKQIQYIVPRRATESESILPSGISADVAGQVIAPGETCLLSLYTEHYRPTKLNGAVTVFQEGKYRLSLTFEKPDGSSFDWASTHFRMVAGETPSAPESVSLTAGRKCYAPATPQISYRLENRMDGTVSYTGGVSVQKLRGGRWTTLSGVHDMGTASTCAPGETVEGILTFDDKLGEGTYRLVTNVTGINFVSGQFTVPGNNRLRLSIVPVQASVDWYAPGEDKRVKKDWWGKTGQTRDLWMTADDLYDGQSAPLALLRELEAFYESKEPVGFKKDILVEVTLWDANDKNVTASLFSNNNGTYCLVADKWYQNSDTNVLTRIEDALDQVATT